MARPIPLDSPDSITMRGILAWTSLHAHRSSIDQAETCLTLPVFPPMRRSFFRVWLAAQRKAQSTIYMALAFGVSQRQIERWLDGTRNPSRPVLILAGILSSQAADLPAGLPGVSCPRKGRRRG